jgi:hypothetical protein
LSSPDGPGSPRGRIGILPIISSALNPARAKFSPRPGHIIYEAGVGFSRPRDRSIQCVKRLRGPPISASAWTPATQPKKKTQSISVLRVGHLASVIWA